MLENRICEVCNKEFIFRNMPSRSGRGRFCSRKCTIIWTKGKHLSPITEFKVGQVSPKKGQVLSEYTKKKISEALKGRAVWNKGTKGLMPDPWNKGKKLPYIPHPKQIGKTLGKKNGLWKGDDVKYHGLHSWVIRHKGKPNLCEHCGTTTAKRFEWANIDGKYRRNLDDFIRLCSSCHMKYDNQHQKMWKTRKHAEY